MKSENSSVETRPQSSTASPVFPAGMKSENSSVETQPSVPQRPHPFSHPLVNDVIAVYEVGKQLSLDTALSSSTASPVFSPAGMKSENSSVETPPSVPQRPHPFSHPLVNDVIAVLAVGSLMILYWLFDDQLLLFAALVLMCLYVFYIRRRSSVPPFGTHDYNQYIENIS
ncbi:hypothetical protein J6590_052812 [Homalodisca vitripennis]|nr:hypothetical protein J6590_052812 [Homalodisca vitripennis]